MMTEVFNQAPERLSEVWIGEKTPTKKFINCWRDTPEILKRRKFQYDYNDNNFVEDAEVQEIFLKLNLSRIEEILIDEETNEDL
jgi:hypothetical protein